jgi:hypothetical protein
MALLLGVRKTQQPNQESLMKFSLLSQVCLDTLLLCQCLQRHKSIKMIQPQFCGDLKWKLFADFCVSQVQ